MAQLPNPFIPNSVAHPPNSDAADTAGVAPQPPVAPAGTISVSDGVLGSSQPSVEMELSATEATAPSETEGAVSVSTASFDISDIHEIFHYVRKLMKQPPRFVLDEAEFMAEVEETPLFLREDGYLQRREA